jgi:hypothetical protein
VRRFCEDAGLSYAEDGVIASYRMILSQLDAVGRGGTVPELAVDTAGTWLSTGR